MNAKQKIEDTLLEIHFRAWDNGQMIYQVEKFDRYKAMAEFFSSLSSEAIVMRFTSLRCGMRKIYEGDIIENKEFGIYKVCRWDNKQGAFCFCHVRCMDEYDDYSYYLSNQRVWQWQLDEQKFEVIGNIYENVELLESIKSAKSVKSVESEKGLEK